MKLNSTSLAGVYQVDLTPIEDERGRFTRLFCQKELSAILQDRPIVQINSSRSKNIGTIRGFHYQIPPYTETKFIQCTRGSVHDVVVDLRKKSETFLNSFSCDLTENDNLMLVVPAGIAHGFQTLNEDSELLYFHSEYYQPDHEAGIRYDDPVIQINWPLTPTLISPRDRAYKLLNDNFEGLVL